MKNLNRLMLCVVLASLMTAWAVAQESDAKSRAKFEPSTDVSPRPEATNDCSLLSTAAPGKFTATTA